LRGLPLVPADDVHRFRKTIRQGNHPVRRNRECEILGRGSGDGTELHARRTDAPDGGGDLFRLGGDFRDTPKEQNLQTDLARKAPGE